MNLPYLLASLPYLMFDAPAPIKAEAFLTACREHLSTRDAEEVALLLNGEFSQSTRRPVDPSASRNNSQAGMPVLRLWREKETDLRDAIARCRVSRRGKGKALATKNANHVSRDDGLERGVEAAFQLADPAARDTALDRLRWQAAESMEGLDPMARGAVFAYAAKLRLCLRRAAMTREAGLPLAENLCNAPLPEAVETKGES